MKWVNLCKKFKLDKKVVIIVFSFFFDKGNVGIVVYLDVFGFIYEVMKGFQGNGYDV